MSVRQYGFSVDWVGVTRGLHNGGGYAPKHSKLQKRLIYITIHYHKVFTVILLSTKRVIIYTLLLFTYFRKYKKALYIIYIHILFQSTYSNTPKTLLL